jgi:hypothetical protein
MSAAATITSRRARPWSTMPTGWLGASPKTTRPPVIEEMLAETLVRVMTGAGVALLQPARGRVERDHRRERAGHRARREQTAGPRVGHGTGERLDRDVRDPEQHAGCRAEQEAWCC